MIESGAKERLNDKVSATDEYMDTRHIVRKHLENPNHTISLEELNSVRVGVDSAEIAEHPKLKELSAWLSS